MTLADVSAVAAIMADNLLWQRYGVTMASATRRLQRGLETSATIAVAEVEERVAGFVWYVAEGAFQRSGYIMLFGVAPDMQGQGVGRALLTYAERALFAANASIVLLVSDFNHDAQRFYQRHGYVQVGALPDYVKTGVNELIYYKRKPPQN
ncbi:MAG TPA: GNAT family N-acetyltransferase [Chloroflexi bacterium]|nr:GNAT family N-acetyltransferase [Chloroflexota bacterium]